MTSIFKKILIRSTQYQYKTHYANYKESLTLKTLRWYYFLGSLTVLINLKNIPMKKNFEFKSTLKILSATLFVVLFLSACNKDEDLTPIPTAHLMAFNLAVDKPAVGFTLSGNQFGNNVLDYSAYTGTYLPIFSGSREVRSFDFTTGSTIAINQHNFSDSTYYSAFLIGYDGDYENVVVQDDYDQVTPVSGKAWIRYINAIADSTLSSSVSIGMVDDNSSYGTVSPFSQVNAGSVDVTVSSGSSFDVQRTIELEENKIYTILFIGSPNHQDPDKTVAIRFIENGTATL